MPRGESRLRRRRQADVQARPRSGAGARGARRARSAGRRGRAASRTRRRRAGSRGRTRRGGGPSAGQERAVDPDVRPRARRPRRVTRTSRAPIAPSGPRALATVSSHSAAGSLRQVMPPPTWRLSRSPSATNVRIRMLVPIAPSGPSQPAMPVYGPRRTGSSRSSSSIARIFGAPVIEPPGNEAASRSNASRPGGEAARHGARPGAARRRSARGGTGAGRGRVPGRQTRPRSLRRTSTIITFSARSFAEARSSPASRRSSARSRPRGRVPLIGFVATSPSGSSGQERLGRCRRDRARRAGERARAEVEERGEQRRVAGAQAAVQRPRIAAERRREPARQVRLVDLAVGDPAADPLDARLVGGSVEAGSELEARRLAGASTVSAAAPSRPRRSLAGPRRAARRAGRCARRPPARRATPGRRGDPRR